MEDVKERQEQQPEEVNIIEKKKKERGVVQLTLAEYNELKSEERKKRKKKKKAPSAIKMFIAIPVGILCLLGAFFIVYLGIQMFLPS